MNDPDEYGYDYDDCEDDGYYDRPYEYDNFDCIFMTIVIVSGIIFIIALICEIMAMMQLY